MSVFSKCVKVVESCETMPQVKVAWQYIRLANATKEFQEHHECYTLLMHLLFQKEDQLNGQAT